MPVKWIGCYSQRARDLSTWATRRRINFAMHWEGESGKVTQRDWRAAARAAGLKYVDTFLEDADFTDPHLIGFLVKGSDEWNRARKDGKRPDPAPFIAEAKHLAAENARRGTDKVILANADGPAITTAMWEPAKPYDGVANNEKALLPLLTGRGMDWYPRVLTGANTPAEIARRPMYLPAQAMWRIDTWCQAWGAAPPRIRFAIVEAAKGWKSPLGVTPDEMREQVDYLTGAKPFPVPGPKAVPQQHQAEMIDMLVWWTANGQDGPGWNWFACTPEQEAAMVEINTRLLGAATPPPANDPRYNELVAQIGLLTSQVNSLTERFARAGDAMRGLATSDNR